METISDAAADPRRASTSGRRASAATVASLAARALRAAGRLGAFWLAARHFPTAEVGSFAFWLAAGTLASMLGDLGLSEHLMRTAPATGDRAAPLLATALRLRVAAGAALALATFAVAVLVQPADVAVAAGAFVFGVATGAADFLAAARRARGRFGLEALESGVAAGGGLVCAAAAAVLGLSLGGFAVALGGSTLLVVAWRLLVLRAETAGATSAAETGRSVVAASRWLWLRALAGWAFLDAVVLLLTFVSGAVEVALFAGAARLVGLMTQPLIALNWVFTPALAHEAAASRERFDAAVRRLNLISLLAAPAGVALCALAGRLVLAGFGAEFRAAEPALLLLALAFAVHGSVLGTGPLIVLGADRAVVLAALGGLAVTFAGVGVLSPASGAVGAAAAVLAGIAVTKLAGVGLYRRRRLPLGGALQGTLALALGGWFAAVGLAAPGLARDGLLVAGGAAGGLAALRLLHRTRIVRSG